MERNGMTGKGSDKEEHFKKIERTDRGKISPHGNSSSAPNPNKDEHSPKIVPWK